MTGCLTPRHHGQDEPTPTEAGTHLCHTCRRHLRRNLTQLPTLHTILAAAIIPPSAIYSQRHRLLTGADPSDSLPFNEPASDNYDQIRHDLIWWARVVAEDRRTTIPPPPHPEALVPHLAGWLTPALRWIHYRPWAPDMAGALADDTGHAWALIQPRVVKTITWMDLCPTCGTLRELRAVVYGTEGDRRTSYIECMTCWTREGFGPGWIRWKATARKVSA